MVKVVIPGEPINLFQTTGNALILRTYKTVRTVSKTFTHRAQPPSAQAIIRAIGEARHTEWNALTDGQRNAWQTLAEDNYQTGFQLYMQEGWKKYLQSIYGFARYGQQVYMP